MAGRGLVVEALTQLLQEVRTAIASEAGDETEIIQDLETLSDRLRTRVLERLAPKLRTVVNATGVILHTNLGRALLSPSATARLIEAAQRYTNLEFDIARGARSSRDQNISRLLAESLHCEAGTVVNNNAAAVFLILNTLAQGKEVLVSRGELVEIGGSFRIPDIMQRSGAVLREVGTTNKTRRRDYEEALTPNTGLILRVHPSNYRIIGFTERPSLEELVQWGRERDVPVVEDLGSGCLVDLSPYGIIDEPVVQQSLRAGVSLACFSGDKLLGGPQAGIVAGRADLVQRLRKNPLMRMLRVDKLTYAALEATLLAYRRGTAFDEIPVLRMIRTSPAVLEARAKHLQWRLREVLPADVTPVVREGASIIGGGSCPEVALPTALLALSRTGGSPASLEAFLRAYTPPIITRVEDDCVLIDLRTVLPEQEPVIVEACAKYNAEQ